MRQEASAGAMASRESGVIFRPWPKTPRLFKDMVITEKIDGTNACVVVRSLDALEVPHAIAGTIGNVAIVPAGVDGFFGVWAQSRNRLITPEKDNAGFAAWVKNNAAGLVETLGEGYHYGEWYGQGIQRGYGLDHKRFALFNVNRYGDLGLSAVPNLETVPVLYEGEFDTEKVRMEFKTLMQWGSVAVPGYMNPEGIIVFHSASQNVYKVTDAGDLPKWRLKAAA